MRGLHERDCLLTVLSHVEKKAKQFYEYLYTSFAKYVEYYISKQRAYEPFRRTQLRRNVEH